MTPSRRAAHAGHRAPRGQTPDEAARAYCGDNGLDLEAVAPELAKVLADNLAKHGAAAGAA